MSDDLIKALQKEAREDAEIITRIRAYLAAVTEERDRMREALEFYGWAEHWVNKPYRQSVIAYDRGRRARAALEGVTEPQQSGAGNE